MPVSYATDAALVRTIRSMAHAHLTGLMQWVPDPQCRSCLHEISSIADSLLSAIHDLVRSGQIQPSHRLALAENEGTVAINRNLRIGVYPLAANPMHWGHILVGLAVVAFLKLDKIVFVIAGKDDRKPLMTSPEIRHRLGVSVLEKFSPIFEYSPIALGTGLDGETNFGRILTLNSRQRMETWYIAGKDHYRRRNPAGEPDTLEKLERVVREKESAGNRNHSISLVFVERGGESREEVNRETFLSVQLLPSLPVALSSTAARRALCNGGTFCDAVVALPYACLLPTRANAGKPDVRTCFDD